jgi:ribosomal protein S18 acetylase RimI-like enzyme
LADSELERAHLNLVDSSRLFYELDPGSAIEAEPGWLFGAGSATHPVISNAAFRRTDDIDAEDFIARALEFFATRKRRFSIWLRAERAADRDLAAAAEAAGFEAVYEMPEMLLSAPLAAEPLPAGAELRRLNDPDQALDFWEVAKAAYATNGFPPEVFAGYTRHEGLLAEDVAAFVAYLDEEPASIAMTIVNNGIAGIYWVGSHERARGKGLGRAVTVAATNAGFDLGGEIASLQASPMGRPIYTKLGYETAFDYRLLISPAP